MSERQRSSRETSPRDPGRSSGLLRKLVAGVAAWTLLVTLAHVGANVGFRNLVEDVRTALGIERRSLRVGFLPVT